MSRNSNSLQLLRAALQAVPGYAALPEGAFPTLPILEAIEFGQQHLVTTFALGEPAATLLPTEPTAPAVSLHLILPEGYSYWQLETGTMQYLGAAQHPDDLPPAHAQILAGRVAQLPAGPHYPPALLADYLALLEQVAAQGWLLGQNANPPAEKAVAQQFMAYLPQLAEPELAAYYQGRGQRLLAWLAAATYEPNWMEKALAAIWRTLPEWAAPTPEALMTLQAAAPVPAVLDGRACIIVALCATAPATAGQQWVYPPGLACYVAYPDLGVQWRPLRGVEHFAVFSLPRDDARQPSLGLTPAAPTAPESARLYQQLVAELLTQGWLQPHQPVLAAEVAAARALQPYLAAFQASPLAPFYEVEARPLAAWVRGVLREEG